MIRIDAVWLAVEPLDMRAGTESALARVVNVFGAARPHHAYLFANRRANRMKVLVHDGIGVWLAARRLNQGKFVWPREPALTVTLSARSSTPWCSACPGNASAKAGIITVL
ncbi:MAG: IS66 family insertion sequence element accessory protein TnpB [Betaproteobacteria bacterium]|nr:IS66 family insertion sequence element accessory protein TnpB [Betaproteobacteria bacterium]